ncbi:MAG TPA: hypothetical protein DCY35_10215, partial [Prolixibacteraceae bacterium]|nr:hypothetical protein [Prolixibacteraceae bacterium]
IVRIIDDYIELYDWNPGSEIILTVEDPNTPISPDYSEQKTVGLEPPTFWLSGIIDLKPGLIVNITDGAITTSQVLTNLGVSQIDWEQNFVFGIAPAESRVNVAACDFTCSFIQVTTGTDGEWAADFNGIRDFSQTTWLMTDQTDDDGDRMEAYPPIIGASAGQVGGYKGYLGGIGWDASSMLHITIDDPSTPELIDFETYYPVGTGGRIDEYQIDYGDFVLRAGQIVTMRDVQFTNSYRIPVLSIEVVDQEGDRVFGKADPNVIVEGMIRQSEGNCWRYTYSDVNGDWSLDYSVPGPTDDELDVCDIKGGSNVSLKISQRAGETYVMLDAPYESGVTINLDNNQINGGRWYPGELVTLTITDVDNGIFTSSTYPDELNNIWFDLGDYQLRPNQVVHVESSRIEKNLIVTDFHDINIDEESDIVTGYSTPNKWVFIITCDDLHCVMRDGVSDDQGYWEGDFSKWGDALYEQDLFDIRPEITIQIQEGGSYRHEYDATIMTIFYKMQTDTDGDGILDLNDNAPFIFNPDQGDMDEDTIADVLDACPNDFDNQCDTEGSAVMVIGPEGGQFTTPNGAVTFIVPAGQIYDWTTFSVTGQGSGISIGTTEGELTSIYTGDFQPDGFRFYYPDFAALIFRWSDSDNDGIVDGTNIAEDDLLVVRDGMIISNYCGESPEDCDVVNNQFRVLIGHFCTVSLAGVQNTSPIITQFNASILPVEVSTSTTATVEFSDPDANDLHTIVLDWGDGTSSSGNVDEVAQTGFGSHEYSVPGVYTVTALLSDSRGATSTKTFEYIVVFDPTGGFVTGGGWINVPAGSLSSDPSIIGKMIFGFEAKYLKNTSIPTGKSNLTFKTGNFFFDSMAYTWMTVTGDKVIIRGVGNTNGESGYGFQINAFDGDVFSSGQDLIRIRVWDLQTGDTIFDTQSGDYAFADPDLPIDGGSIQIHK